MARSPAKKKSAAKKRTVGKSKLVAGMRRGIVAGALGNREKVKVFINYAKADNSIAVALSEEMVDINRDRVECFLDTQTIQSGEGWQAKLETFLKEADWLVCIYTGQQSDFCGYEVGVFTDGKALARKKSDSRVVCLHDVDYPILFQNHQNRLIEMPPGEVTSDKIDLFYRDCGLAKFFEDFCRYKDLYVPTDRSGSDKRSADIIRKAKRITEAFRDARGDIEIIVTPTQLGFDVTVPCKRDEKLKAIPATAQVKGTFQSFGLLGLMPSRRGEEMPSTGWSTVLAACQSPYTAHISWIERLERDMLNAANGWALRESEAVFRGKDEKVYRAILHRHAVCRNGTHRFGIILVETLLRQFLGGDSPSQVLAFLLVASRFFSLYLEEQNRTIAKFDDELTDLEFQANYCQFLEDLDLMKEEARSLGLLDPEAFIEAFGDKNRGASETFLQATRKAGEALEAALPSRSAPVDSTNRPKIKEAIMQFVKNTKIENTRFLKIAANAYRDELERLLSRAGS